MLDFNIVYYPGMGHIHVPPFSCGAIEVVYKFIKGR